MKYLKTITTIFLISFVITIIGFILDLGERIPNIWVNMFDILIMTGVIFLIIISFYLFFLLITKGFNYLRKTS